MNFTPEEKWLLVNLARSESWMRVAHAVAWFLPMLVLAAYGIIYEHLVANMVAMFAIASYLLWSLITELRYAAIYQSLARKVLAACDEGATRR